MLDLSKRLESGVLLSFLISSLYLSLGPEFIILLSFLLSVQESVSLKYGFPLTIYIAISHYLAFYTQTREEILLLTQISDIFQYFVGKLFGRRKGIISVSPNKSLEGYLGGMLLAWGVGALFKMKGASLIVVSGVGGDLLLSWIKRRNGVKDISDLLSGHGGWLDRIDSTLMAFLIFYFFGP